MQEKRKSIRMGIDVTIKLNEVKNFKRVDDLNKKEMVVNLVNVSRDGLAFKSEEELKLNTYYDVHVVLWTKETFDSVIEIVRMENLNNEPEILYGCRFIGLRPADQLKIHIHEILLTEGNIEEN